MFQTHGEFALTEGWIAKVSSASPSLWLGHLTLTETMCRMVYVLAILNREELHDDGRRGDFDEFVTEAQEVMHGTKTEEPG